MYEVFSQVMTLIIILLIGLFLAKLNVLNQETRKKLSELLLNVTSPLLVLKSFQIEYSSQLINEMIIVVLAATVVIAGGVGLGYIVWRKAPQDKKLVLIFGGGFPNVGYMGYPILGGLFGDKGILFVALAVMVFQICTWTIGVMIFTGKTEKWYKSLLRPGLATVIIGLFMFFFSIKLPAVLYNVTDMVGGMTSPLAMLLAGAYLADNKFKTLFNDKYIYAIAFIRIIFWPSIVAFALSFLHLDYVLYACCVIIAAMPVSVTTVMFSAQFDSNPAFASKLITMTTLISMLSVIGWMYIVQLIA